jgi:hypothetical protein
MKTYLLHVTFNPSCCIVDTVSMYLTFEEAVASFTSNLDRFRPDIYRICLKEYEDGVFCDTIAFYLRPCSDDSDV